MQALVIIRTDADTGVATGVVKIGTGHSVKRQSSANCLCIPAKTIAYVSELRKVHCSGLISIDTLFVGVCRSTSSSSHAE